MMDLFSKRAHVAGARWFEMLEHVIPCILAGSPLLGLKAKSRLSPKDKLHALWGKD